VIKLEAALIRTIKPIKVEIKLKNQEKADDRKSFVHFGIRKAACGLYYLRTGHIKKGGH